MSLMRRMRDLECKSCGRVTEFFRPDAEFDQIKATGHHEGIECPTCGGVEFEVQRSCPRAVLEGVTGAFPTAADRWATVHEQAARVGAKRNEGKYDDPNYHR